MPKRSLDEAAGVAASPAAAAAADLPGTPWCLIESDPGTFTDLVRMIGVQETQVDEVYGLDDASLAPLEPILGLIFLFRWRPVDDDDGAGEADAARPEGDEEDARRVMKRVYFANQIIENACATQAVLSVVLNAAGIDIGEELQHFRDFTKDFTPALKGLAISNSRLLKQAHHSFARFARPSRSPFAHRSGSVTRTLPTWTWIC